MKGLITSVQCMSIHDGPGIRSTIFLKGCNLNCAWCHNPETISPYPELEWIGNKCINCYSCTAYCPENALQVKNGFLDLDKTDCTNCFRCVPECYPEALIKVGRKITAKELFNEIVEDSLFFEFSNGGVTISGGEPLLQKEFAKELLQLFSMQEIHTALDTNMTAPWNNYEEILPFANLVLADLKLIDESLHKKWTGRNNRQILRNIVRLDETAIPYYLRIPVIPGVNDNETEMFRIAEFISKLENYKKVELLPFHSMGSYKYKSLGKKNPMPGIQNPGKTDILKFEDILKMNQVNI